MSDLNPLQEIAVADAFPPMEEILNYLHIPYQSIPGQISCPVHKLGGETRKSARLYEDGLYCFTCLRQYRPTEIWASVRVVERFEAAREINRIWVADPETVERVIKDLNVPRKASLDQSLVSFVEGCLREYKHRVPLGLYRAWALRIDSLPEFLIGVRREDRRSKVMAMKNQMRREFDDADPEKLAVED